MALATAPLYRRCPSCGGTLRCRGRSCTRCDAGRVPLDDRTSALFLGWTEILLASAGIDLPPAVVREITQRWVEHGADNPGRFEGHRWPAQAPEPRLVAAFGLLQ